MKTPTMPEDRAISGRRASTEGMPVAPSAARLERLRRPIAIIAPQPTRPNTPAIIASHFHQASRVFTVFDRPGGAAGAGFGTAAARARMGRAARSPRGSAGVSGGTGKRPVGLLGWGRGGRGRRGLL